ncbi:MAG: hypothetical protein SWH78_03290 [Thermodesulfobacteriota bacterium]|nr:hypothetical protein [Thermodesulfobacteriota bacterium]
MEFLQTAELTVPLMQIMLLLSLSTIILIIGRIRLALCINYLFALYWGYVFNADLFNSIEKASMFNSVYVGFGIVVVIFAVIGFVAHAS